MSNVIVIAKCTSEDNGSDLFEFELSTVYRGEKIEGAVFKLPKALGVPVKGKEYMMLLRPIAVSSLGLYGDVIKMRLASEVFDG